MLKKLTLRVSHPAVLAPQKPDSWTKVSPSQTLCRNSSMFTFGNDCQSSCPGELPPLKGLGGGKIGLRGGGVVGAPRRRGGGGLAMGLL